MFLDLSSLELVLSETNEFTITWERAYAPTGHEVEAYNVTVFDQDDKIIERRSINATSEELHYSYVSAQSRLEFPECSRLLFSVVAVANRTRSQGENVTWAKPRETGMHIVLRESLSCLSCKYLFKQSTSYEVFWNWCGVFVLEFEAISGESCSILGSQSVRVSFDVSLLLCWWLYSCTLAGIIKSCKWITRAETGNVSIPDCQFLHHSFPTEWGQCLPKRPSGVHTDWQSEQWWEHETDARAQSEATAGHQWQVRCIHCTSGGWTDSKDNPDQMFR